MVENLTRMTIERLQLYQKKNRRLPDRVIVYRDGVSEVSMFVSECGHHLHLYAIRANTTRSSTRNCPSFEQHSLRYPPRPRTSLP